MHKFRSPKLAILLAAILGACWHSADGFQPRRARPLLSQEVNGVLVTESAPVIGVALSAPLPGRATIPVFVTLR